MRATWSALRNWWSRGVEDERALARDDVIRLPRWREGTSIVVRSGVVLVTRAGDADDHVLAAGAELLLPSRGLAVAWAMEASWIEIRRGAARAADGRRGRAAPEGACTPCPIAGAERAHTRRHGERCAAPPTPSHSYPPATAIPSTPERSSHGTTPAFRPILTVKGGPSC
ncbi:MAG TPA: DUF2917 domain-containing protein [Anaeromyxobacteraceae bacterium]|nr:DUF2917 domain-containing protein [Anaeromyxobacteraceae bacterium]